MVRGYVLLYDERGEEGRAVLQKKAYFQSFSVQREVFTREPVCGNPGQYTLPGGGLDKAIVRESGHFEASMKQFCEESGITWERLEELNVTSKGHCVPDSAMNGQRILCYIHFVQVDDVDIVVREANSNLQGAKSIVTDTQLTALARETILRELFQINGLNDDAADCYEVVNWSEILSRFEISLEFEESHQIEWARLIREQGLLFNAEHGQEERIRSILSDPGQKRDWLTDGVSFFLSGFDINTS